jgi:hypothetical protein
VFAFGSGFYGQLGIPEIRLRVFPPICVGRPLFLLTLCSSPAPLQISISLCACAVACVRCFLRARACGMQRVTD